MAAIIRGVAASSAPVVVTARSDIGDVLTTINVTVTPPPVLEELFFQGVGAAIELAPEIERTLTLVRGPSNAPSMGTISWTTSNSYVRVTPAGDGLSAVIRGLEVTTVPVTITATSDLLHLGSPISVSVDVEVALPLDEVTLTFELDSAFGIAARAMHPPISGEAEHPVFVVTIGGINFTFGGPVADSGFAWSSTVDAPNPFGRLQPGASRNNLIRIPAQNSPVTVEIQYSHTGGTAPTGLAAVRFPTVNGDRNNAPQVTTSAFADHINHPWSIPAGTSIVIGCENSIRIHRVKLTLEGGPPPAPTGLTISGDGVQAGTPKTLALNVGQTRQLSAARIPAHSTGGTITWESDNPAVATVNAERQLSAVAEGTATITATLSGDGVGPFTDTVLVTVSTGGGAPNVIFSWTAADNATAPYTSGTNWNGVPVVTTNSTITSNETGLVIPATGRFLLGRSSAGTATSGTVHTEGNLDLSRAFQITIDYTGLTGAGNSFQVYLNNNSSGTNNASVIRYSTGQANSGTAASRITALDITHQAAQ
jgi:uncharacterized protein YjdB